MIWKNIGRVGLLWAVFGGVSILNFVVFVAVASHLGGDAINGKAEGGHYYLFGTRNVNGKKVYTEVSQSVFTYSRWHVYSIFVTWPILMVGSVVLNKKYKPRR